MYFSSLNWYTLAVIASISVSVVGIFQKKALKHKTTDPIAFSIYFQLLVGIIAIPFCSKNFSSIKPSFDLIFGLAIVSILYCLANVLFYYSLKIIELSQVRIITSTRPIWLLVGGFIVFNESLTIKKCMAVLLAVFGIGFVYWKKGNFKGFGKPQMLIFFYTLISY